METILEPPIQQHTDIQEHIEGAFGNAPFDIYTYKGIYHHTENGLAIDLRQKMVLLYESGEYTQKDIALLFNCTERVVRKWIKRYREEGTEGLKDQSRAPHTRYPKNDEQLRTWITQIMRDIPFYGCRRVAREIEKRYLIKVSHELVNQIMQQMKRKPIVHAGVIEVEKPNMVWHMDMTQIMVYRKNQYIFGVVDACTRQLHGLRNYDRKTSKSAVDTLIHAIIHAKTAPKELWLDNGLMFTSKTFRVYCMTQGIKVHYIPKGSPWLNGKIERFFRTLKSEWIRNRRYKTPKGLRESLKEFQHYYNHVREIQKLDYRTPKQIERIKTHKLIELKPMNSYQIQILK